MWTFLAVSATACWGKAQMSVQYAAGFQPARHKVSIFGVYKDGRMSSEAWGGIAPGVTKALGGKYCDAVYGTPVFPADLTKTIDEYATSNGPTDDLLGQIAPAATGDLVMVLTVAGHLPVPIKVSVQDQPQQVRPGGAYGARGQHRGKDLDLNELQLAAQVFSVAEGKTVAVVNLDYTGQSVDEAWTTFTAQIGESLPGSECTGWRADAKLDADRIRALGQ